MKGTVKWFNVKKGYGFITEDETGKEYFVHYTNIQSKSNFKKLDEGQKVTFDLEDNPKGTMAVNVVVA